MATRAARRPLTRSGTFLPARAMLFNAAIAAGSRKPKSTSATPAVGCTSVTFASSGWSEPFAGTSCRLTDCALAPFTAASSCVPFASLLAISILCLCVFDDAHLRRLVSVERKDFVDLQPARQLVRDVDDGHVALQLVHRLSEALGRRRVEVARRLVEDQHARPLEDGTRDGEALLLAAREADAVLAELAL